MIELNEADIGITNPIIRNVSVKAEPGSLIGLTGVNGSGKSTLLRTLAGNLPLLGGSVKLNNTPIGDLARKELAKTVSITMHNPYIYGNATFRDVIELGRLPHAGFLAQLNETDKKLVTRAMSDMGIGSMGNKQFKEASDGEKQKCMLARCLAQNTPVILLDEPTAYLDHPSRIGLFQLLRDLCASKQVSILLSSHDLSMIETYCDRIWLIEAGSLIASDQPGFSDKWQQLNVK